MLSVKHARKQEVASTASRMTVAGLVTASHMPLLVNKGVRSWKAKRVPVGSRFARFAVPVNACDRAVCDIDGCLWRRLTMPPVGVSGCSTSWMRPPALLEEEVLLTVGPPVMASLLVRRDISR
ncbi:hypothetical protein SAY87_027449 [Trapa incisa]|uniref:Uncharacterized protein n=1 Tax=Trapa incisa TaxID=236973 RepID=A0AAN7H0V6_9MYRT|nr:hypothetical protein SAY87_027449 [Trapa incisa]